MESKLKSYPFLSAYITICSLHALNATNRMKEIAVEDTFLQVYLISDFNRCRRENRILHEILAFARKYALMILLLTKKERGSGCCSFVFTVVF